MPTRLLQLIDPLRGLDGHVKEAQDAPHDVDHCVRHPRRGVDVADVPADVVEHEGLGELSGEAPGELRGGHVVVFPREAVELLEGRL